MKRSIIFLLIFILSISSIITGCSSSNQKESGKESNEEQQQEKEKITETVFLYYADRNNENLVTEKRQISYYEGQDKYKTVLEELIKGPIKEDYHSRIKKETHVYGTMKQNDKLVVDFSEEFNQFAGALDELMAIAAVVNTMTQFEEINQVKILVNKKELIGPSGEPRGFMEPFTK